MSRYVTLMPQGGGPPLGTLELQSSVPGDPPVLVVQGGPAGGTYAAAQGFGGREKYAQVAALQVDGVRRAGLRGDVSNHDGVYGVRNGRWVDGRGTNAEVARRMIESGHGLTEAQIDEFHARVDLARRRKHGEPKPRGPADEFRQLLEMTHGRKA